MGNEQSVQDQTNKLFKPASSDTSSNGIRRIDMLMAINRFHAKPPVEPSTTPLAPVNPFAFGSSTTQPFPATPGTFSFKFPSSPQTSLPSSSSRKDEEGVLKDTRIVKAADSKLVHSYILGDVLSLLPLSFHGDYVRTIPVLATGCRGMAVNAAETVMAVTYPRDTLSGVSLPTVKGSRLMLYTLPDCTYPKIIEENGFGADEFDQPRQVTFVPGTDNIMVADVGADCVYEFTSTGEFVYTWRWHAAKAISFNHTGDQFVVGTGPSDEPPRVTIIDYKTRNIVREIGAGRLDRLIAFVRFTPDDKHVLVPTSCALADMYSVTDGSFVRTLCQMDPLTVPDDLTFSVSGEIIIADTKHGEISVFSPDGDRLLHKWGSYGHMNSQFNGPIALCYVKGRLYVLDFASSRVQVFE